MFSFQHSENFYVAWCNILLGRRGWEPFPFQMFALLTRPKVGPFSFPDLGPNVVQWKHKCWKTWKGDDPTCKDVCNGYGKGFEQKIQTISLETEWAEPQFAVWGQKKSEWFFTFSLWNLSCVTFIQFWEPRCFEKTCEDAFERDWRDVCLEYILFCIYVLPCGVCV